MKLNVKIGEKNYTVEIGDLNARPILAVVDGELFEVTPQTSEQPHARKETAAHPEAAPKGADLPSALASEKSLHAPLPGTVIEIFVKDGDEIESGQVVLVIEAMKMKNSIRSTRDGKIAAVLVEAGQTVNHKQTLLEFE
jgi:glutaconyl-CoA/methylmalonyl-CoA decarboxylase subunit gamma